MLASGTPNSNYYMLVEADQVHMYRRVGPEQVAGDTRPLSDLDGKRPLGMTNLGQLFCRDTYGFYRVRHPLGGGELDLEPVPLGESEGELGAIRVDAGGKQFCFEQITPDTGLKGKLIKLFQKAAGNLHHLHVMELDSPLHYHFKFAVDAEQSSRFLWNMSAGCCYLVAAIPVRTGFNIQVVDVLEETIVEDFELNCTSLEGAWIYDSGALLVELDQQGRRLILGQPRAGRMPKAFQPPEGFRVLHLARDYVAVRVGDRVLLYDYDGKCFAEADCPHPLSFCDAGDLEVLRFEGAALQVERVKPREFANYGRGQVDRAPARAEVPLPPPPPEDPQDAAVLLGHDKVEEVAEPAFQVPPPPPPPEDLEEAASLLRHKAVRAPQLPAPPLETHEPVFAPPLDFRKPIPPPITEGVDSPQVAKAPPSVSVGVPLQPPPHPSAQPAASLDPQSARAELEKLRLRYISGEVSEHDFAERRAVLERFISAEGGPAKPSLLRLDLPG